MQHITTPFRVLLSVRVLFPICSGYVPPMYLICSYRSSVKEQTKNVMFLPVFKKLGSFGERKGTKKAGIHICFEQELRIQKKETELNPKLSKGF